MATEKEKNFVSAVVYMHNDETLAEDFLVSLDKTLSETFLKYEIIVVNDHSSDRSAEAVRRAVAERGLGCVTLLTMSYNQGLETSMNAGVDLAIGDFVFEFDSMYVDFPWQTVVSIYRHSLSGYDIVNACNGRRQRLSSGIFYALMNKYAHLQYHIETETFRVLSRRAINRVHDLSESIPYRKAAYANCGLRMATKTYEPTAALRPKPQKGRVGLAIQSLILFTDVAFRVSVSIALLMVAITIGVAIYALAYFFLENPVEGWTTTILFLSFSFCCLFIILSMILKYLSTIVGMNFTRKTYVVEAIDKLQ